MTSAVDRDDGVAFQWYFNGVPLPGKNREYLNLFHIKPEQAGSYFVRAKRKNEVIDSNEAVVTVNSIPTGPQRIDYNLRFEVIDVTEGEAVVIEEEDETLKNLFCNSEGELGEVDFWSLSFEFNLQERTVNVIDSGEVIASGTLDLGNNTFEFTISYDPEVSLVQDGVTFYSTFKSEFEGSFNPADFSSISGTLIDTTISSWSYDSKTVVCTATWIFSGTLTN